MKHFSEIVNKNLNSHQEERKVFKNVIDAMKSLNPGDHYKIIDINTGEVVSQCRCGSNNKVELYVSDPRSLLDLASPFTDDNY